MTDCGNQRLGEFAERHTVELTRFAFLLCHDRSLAEDLVQDAFTALYRRFGDTLPIAAPVAYTRRTITNAFVSRRRLRKHSETVLADLPDIGVDADDHTERDAMWRLLGGLPDRQRAVLVLRYYVDLSDADIAATLGCREGTVRSLASRAVAALRIHARTALLGEPS